MKNFFKNYQRRQVSFAIFSSLPNPIFPCLGEYVFYRNVDAQFANMPYTLIKHELPCRNLFTFLVHS